MIILDEHQDRITALFLKTGEEIDGIIGIEIGEGGNVTVTVAQETDVHVSELAGYEYENEWEPPGYVYENEDGERVSGGAGMCDACATRCPCCGRTPQDNGKG